jgi:hypothetical protein
VTSLVDRLATAIDRRARGAGRVEAPSRLAETAVKASAAVVAPVAFATRPVSARELLNRTCADCPSGSRCCGGFSAFCCTLPGGDNFGCPPGAYIGGWWQCNYGGNGLCGTTNLRYYLDCNTLPGRQCAGGCHCGSDDCGNFKTCCIDFRYGQCNPQIHGVGVIACRLVTCMIPCRIDCLNCNCSAAVDQLTCTHEAGCL